MSTVGKNKSVNGVEPIPCRLNGPRGVVKAFVLYDEHQAAVVDAGYERDDALRIERCLETLRERNIIFNAIILTHGHGDHIGALRDLRAGRDIPVYCHPAEQESVSAIDPGCNLVPLSDMEHWDAFGGLTFIHMPGHSAGSLAIYQHSSRSLLAGDSIFSAGEHLMVSPAFLCDNPDLARRSVERLLSLKLTIDNVFVAHGEDVCGGAAQPLQRMLLPSRHAIT